MKKLVNCVPALLVVLTLAFATLPAMAQSGEN